MFPVGEELHSNEASLRTALFSLPLNNLMVIAAELLDALDNTEEDIPEDAQKAIENLEQDVLKIGNSRLGGLEFFYAVRNWNARPEVNSRDWYQQNQDKFHPLA